MKEKSVIVIGAGLAGLSAGCYARMNGYDSHIFEQHSQPGGLAAWWKRKSYTIDGGIHFVMGHRPNQPTYDMYAELGIPGNCDFVDIDTFLHVLDERSGRSVEITHDLDHLREALITLFPHDSRQIEELTRAAQELSHSDILFETGAHLPPELAGMLAQVREMWEMRGILKYFGGKFSHTVADYAKHSKDPLFRQIMENLFLPEVPVWFILMLLGLLSQKQLGLLAGGCRDFVGAIEKRFTNLGGEITYKAGVREIIVEGARAVGVKLLDGSERRADVIISAADGYSTIFEMLGGRFADRHIRERYGHWKVSTPAAMVSFGVAISFPDFPPLSLFFLNNPFTIGDTRIEGLSLRIFNYGEKFAPPGKTVVQVMCETTWEFWDALKSRDRKSYDDEKRRLSDKVLERLERHFPGISSSVEVTDVATPCTTWRYTSSRKGSFLGWYPTPNVITQILARTLPGLSGFYMAGQWVVPGGGVNMSLISGRHAVQILCKHDEKEFVKTSSGAAGVIERRI